MLGDVEGETQRARNEGLNTETRETDVTVAECRCCLKYATLGPTSTAGSVSGRMHKRETGMRVVAL